MINCIVTSPTKTDAYKDVLSVTLPAFSGPIEVLSNHAESFIFLQKGLISIRLLERKTESIQITGGECYVKNNVITVIL